MVNRNPDVQRRNRRHADQTMANTGACLLDKALDLQGHNFSSRRHGQTLIILRTHISSNVSSRRKTTFQSLCPMHRLRLSGSHINQIHSPLVPFQIPPIMARHSSHLTVTATAMPRIIRTYPDKRLHHPRLHELRACWSKQVRAALRRRR